MPFYKRIYSPAELQFIAARSWQRMKERVLEGRAAESLGNETLRYPALRSTPREIAGSKNQGWRIRPAVCWRDVCALSKGAQTCQTTARLRHPSFFMSFRGPKAHGDRPQKVEVCASRPKAPALRGAVYSSVGGSWADPSPGRSWRSSPPPARNRVHWSLERKPALVSTALGRELMSQRFVLPKGDHSA
jgi:hypothetical protein